MRCYFRIIQIITVMWENLGSPPENFRFYKFSDHSHDKEGVYRTIDLEEDRANLFPHENLSSVPEESISPTYLEAFSQNTHKPLSSLKSTSKVNSKPTHDKSAYDLKLNCKANHAKPQSKSMLEHASKQKSSLNISQKQKSSIIKEEESRVSARNKENSHEASKQSRMLSYSQNDSHLNAIDNAEEDEFSQIFIKEINKTQEQIRNGNRFKDKQKGEIFIKTLIEIRDLQREQLNYQKRLLKLAEERGKISFLYDQKEQKSQNRFFRNKKEGRKSFKKTQQKSTIKKLGKSLAFEDRLTKVEEKCRYLEKRLKDQNAQKTPLSKAGKKSLSNLR